MKKTKTQRILERLEKGRSITSMQAFKDYNATRLSAIIFELRKKGYNITTELVTKNGTAYAVYRLEK